MFSAVHAALANGGCIGIFPEGGSHDRTDLLPLKVSFVKNMSGRESRESSTILWLC